MGGKRVSDRQTDRVREERETDRDRERQRLTETDRQKTEKGK